jgi:adenylate cyclase
MSAQFGESEYSNLAALADLMKQQSGHSTVPTNNLLPGPSPHSGLYAAALRGLGGSPPSSNTVPISPLAKAFASINASTPKPPSMTTLSAMKDAESRLEKRLEIVKSLLPITVGRKVPDDDDLIIGDARRLRLAVLYVDICKFSEIQSTDENEQDQVFMLLNLFMAEMLHIVKKMGGDFEKNTGDGLMAYFKSSSDEESTRLAIEAAVTMHFLNDQVISPRLKNMRLPTIKFRVGIETGLVTAANVGVRGPHHSVVAIGSVPNVACKLMSLLPDGGIVIGNYTWGLLAEEWKAHTVSIGPLPGWVKKDTQIPYPAFELTYRVARPFDWSIVSGPLGG